MTHEPIRSLSQRLIMIIGLVALLFLTNQWLPWNPVDNPYYNLDRHGYVDMAQQFPWISDGKNGHPYHINQRFFPAYISGMVAKPLGLPMEWGFAFWTVAFGLLLLIALSRLADLFRMPPKVAVLLMSVLILSPYVFRYHMICPAALHGIMYLSFTAVLVWGLKSRSLGLVMAAALLGVLSRQTMVLTLPGIFIWMLFDPAWNNNGRRQLFSTPFMLTTTIMLSGYLLTASVAALSGKHNWNSDHLFQIIPFLQSGQWKIMLGILIRIFIPHAMALFFIIAFWIAADFRGNFQTRVLQSFKKLSFEFYAVALMALLVVAQPAMAGHVTGHPPGSGARLSMLASVSTYLALALAARDWGLWARIQNFSPLAIAASAGLILIAGFHHQGSALIAQTGMQFGMINCLISAIMSLALIIGLKKGNQRDMAIAPSELPVNS